MKLFFRYLWDHKYIFILLAAMLAVFGITLSLYGLPLVAVGYGALLACAAGGLGIGVSFLAYRRRVEALRDKRASIALTLEDLPTAKDLPEQEYQQLLRLMRREQRAITLRSDRAMSDMMDYYTLWAHQIKTPIAAAKLIVDAGEGNQTLSAELFKIEQYVEMVLAYMRLGSESTDYVLRRYPLDGIIRQAVRKYSRLFILKGIALEYEGTDLCVYTDEKWLLFVVEQLLSNAVKYTNAGKVRIYIKEGRLVISDSGIGIRQEDLPRIFEKGFTGFNGREDRQSTGLGLYLTKRVLDKLSHSIVIESDGAGTKVVIGFPRENSMIE